MNGVTAPVMGEHLLSLSALSLVRIQEQVGSLQPRRLSPEHDHAVTMILEFQSLEL